MARVLHFVGQVGDDVKQDHAVRSSGGAQDRVAPCDTQRVAGHIQIQQPVDGRSEYIVRLGLATEHLQAVARQRAVLGLFHGSRPEKPVVGALWIGGDRAAVRGRGVGRAAEAIEHAGHEFAGSLAIADARPNLLDHFRRFFWPFATEFDAG